MHFIFYQSLRTTVKTFHTNEMAIQTGKHMTMNEHNQCLNMWNESKSLFPKTGSNRVSCQLNKFTWTVSACLHISSRHFLVLVKLLLMVLMSSWTLTCCRISYVLDLIRSQTCLGPCLERLLVDMRIRRCSWNRFIIWCFCNPVA